MPGSALRTVPWASPAGPGEAHPPDAVTGVPVAASHPTTFDPPADGAAAARPALAATPARGRPCHPRHGETTMAAPRP